MEILKEIGKKIAKLIDVKSMITLALTGVICYKSVIGEFDIKEIYLMIIAFYFTLQSTKTKEKENTVDNVKQNEIPNSNNIILQDNLNEDNLNDLVEGGIIEDEDKNE